MEVDNEDKEREVYCVEEPVEKDTFVEMENKILRLLADCTSSCIAREPCKTFADDAQFEIISDRYAPAIARWQNFLSLVESLFKNQAVNEYSVSDVAQMKALAFERISLCYLMRDKADLAVKFAQRSIVEKPFFASSHLLRAIGKRRRNKNSSALKSLTLFALINLEECSLQDSCQATVMTYWRKVAELVSETSSNVKLLHLPYQVLSDSSHNEQCEKMCFAFLAQYPLYNCLIHSDVASTHLLPNDNGTLLLNVEEHRQAYGFLEDTPDARYFAKLPNNFTDAHSSNDWQEHDVSPENARMIWEASELLNSTCCILSVKPGKEIFEHLHYCFALVKEERFSEALPEYESILTDLALAPVLSGNDWDEKILIQIQDYTEMIQVAISWIKEQERKRLEKERSIEQIKQNLKLHELKFRAKQCQKKLEAKEGLAKRNRTPKSKYFFKDMLANLRKVRQFSPAQLFPQMSKEPGIVTVSPKKQSGVDVFCTPKTVAGHQPVKIESHRTS
ncbi:spermatogenesis-associated protein 16-like [Clavelina lepadiformis]|uniref:spermatogenesis-associated protein 16-like n=1 Tax=Clavelina lepadiformis TaxID=159417 RepID=UPI0040437116